jgi:hypothetical protein
MDLELSELGPFRMQTADPQDTSLKFAENSITTVKDELALDLGSLTP